MVKARNAAEGDPRARKEFGRRMSERLARLLADRSWRGKDLAAALGRSQSELSQAMRSHIFGKALVVAINETLPGFDGVYFEWRTVMDCKLKGFDPARGADYAARTDAVKRLETVIDSLTGIIAALQTPNRRPLAKGRKTKGAQ